MEHFNLKQEERLRALMKAHPLVRAHELRAAGITSTTISRAEASGLLHRLSRGLYQSPDSEMDSHHAMAEVSKRVPNGVICMLSALAFHGLTDQMPRKVWIAIDRDAWTPSLAYPPIHLVRFTPAYLKQGVERHTISGVEVPIYSIPKTLADVFRNSRLVDRSVAIESLKAALIQRKTTPSEILEAARQGGALNVMRPYLEALTSNG